MLNAYIGVPIMPLTQAPWKDVEAEVTGKLKAAFCTVKAFVPGMIA